MATATVSEARTRLAVAAGRLAGAAPAGTSGESLQTPNANAALSVNDLTQLIKTADRLIEVLEAASTGDVDDREELLIVTAALRQTSYLLLRREVPEQAWFWTTVWQAGEREADADKVAGRSTHHADDHAFLTALQARRPDLADA